MLFRSGLAAALAAPPVAVAEPVPVAAVAAPVVVVTAVGRLVAALAAAGVPPLVGTLVRALLALIRALTLIGALLTLVGTLLRGVANLAAATAVVAPPVVAAPPVGALAFPARLALAGPLAVAGQDGRGRATKRSTVGTCVGRRAHDGRCTARAGVGLAERQLTCLAGAADSRRSLRPASGPRTWAGRDGLGTLPRALARSICFHGILLTVARRVGSRRRPPLG